MNNRQFLKTLTVSVLVHIALLLATIVLPKFYHPIKHEIIEVNYTGTSPTQMKVPEKVRQVVDQDEKPANDEIDEKAKFLSAHNQVVQKQTVATNHGEFKNRKQMSSLQGNGGRPLKLQDLTPKMDFGKMVERKQEQERELEKTLTENALKVAQQQKPAPFQNSRPGSPGADISQTSDHVENVDKGNETLLTTREFVYYSFYARIRRQLNQHWGGKVKEKLTKLLKEGRSIASTDDKVTKLLITLNRKGQLVKVQVLSNSGIRDLDDAAIEAFKEAAPFPNPPPGIVGADGTIQIRWDFVLEA